MTKTLKCNINDNILEAPKYIKITATKVDELEAGVKNLYKDTEGNKYIVYYNKFTRREEFTRL